MGHDVRELLEKLGAFSRLENLKDLLGDLDTTTPKQLGQILGGLTHTDNLKAILGGFTATENLKAILGDLTTTKNLGGVLGAFTTTQNLKAILGDLTTTKNLGGVLGTLTTTNTLYALLGGADAVSNPIASDTKYIFSAAVPFPTVNSLAAYIVSGGTGLGTLLGASRSIIDAIGHNGLAIQANGLGTNIGNFQGETNLKSILSVLGGGWDDANAGAGRDMFTSIEGPTGIFHEQVDAGFSIAVDNVGVDILDLNVASTRYIIRDLRVKLDADPGANTVTISLETLINSLPVVVDTFAIDTANWGTYHSLMDMFGVPHIAGDDVHIFATYSVAGPITLKGQYSHGKTNV